MSACRSELSSRAISGGPSRWIIATFARCHTILAKDAPQLHQALAPAFREAVADLGLSSTGDLLDRAAEVTRFLPRLWQTTENILAGNPDITG